MKNQITYWSIIWIVSLAASVYGQPQSLLQNLAQSPDFETHRISSNDRSGGNSDWIAIEPGETKVLAEIEGPGAITHIWNTIDAEKYNSRMLVIRIYWDGQEIPSVEAPLGDFFGVGHGLNRAFQSMAMDASSDGKARNCYWYMPFRKSAKITITHEGFFRVRHFYYYIDYRKYNSLPDNSLYFHAQYRQAVPNPAIDLKGKNLDGQTNYVLMQTKGKGLYVGSVLSVQNNADGWFGEGDDMFLVDGAATPTLTGTGTEDYFNDAWGFREFSYPYHGVTLWEGYKKGDRGTAYKWHICDPVAFQTSLKATIEHGHANDRQDDWYSVAFWYQTLPSPQVPVIPPVFDRLPDEGQVYAKGLFLNKELSVRLEQGQYKDAMQRIDEFCKENDSADSLGYWSLRKGIYAKQMGDERQSETCLATAVQKSDSREPRALEQDADLIHKYALREQEIVKEGKGVWGYAACAGSYDVIVDGVSIAKGDGWDPIDELELKLSRGKHAVCVVAKSQGSKGGFLLQISSRGGNEITDSTWKVSTQAPAGWEKPKFDDSKWQNATAVGLPGGSVWIPERQESNFVAGLILAKYIWTSESAREGQTVYFRKTIQVR